jgi:hypothetical protein
MSTVRNGGQTSNDGVRNAVALALIAIIPSTITAIGGFVAGMKQAPPPVIRDPPTVKNTREERDINMVRGVFTEATVDPDKIRIHCKGGITNLNPETQSLWLAVEINGHIWFKRSEITYNAARTSWNGTIKEEGGSNTVSLLLYVVTRDAEKEILEWLKEGEKGGKFKEITSVEGTYPIAYLNNLKVRN